MRSSVAPSPVFTSCWRWALTAVVCLCVTSSTASSRVGIPSQFRSGVTLVPVDVRVVDSHGNPITDLTVTDFVLYENGAEQKIVHFAKIVAGGDDGRHSLLPLDHPLAAVTAQHRTFILVLGRGRLSGPVKGIDAVVDFVRQRLLPTDRVGIVAYLRASAPSTNHAAALRFLEAFRTQHEGIDDSIELGYQRAVPRVTLSDDAREKIDSLFRAPGSPAFVSLPGAAGTVAGRYADLNYLRWAIQYASAIPGEKHVVILSQDSLGLNRIAQEREQHVVVRWATSARVAVWYINAGGVSGHSMLGGQLVIGRSGDAVSSMLGISDGEFFAPGDHRILAEQTGGISSFYQYAAKTLEFLDRSSRFHYLLAYYPSESSSREAYRKIRVEIRRQGARSLYRHGYQLQAPESDAGDFQAAAASARLDTALSFLIKPPLSQTKYAHLFMRRSPTLRVTLARVNSAASQVSVTLALDASRIAFVSGSGRYRARLHLVVVVDGAEDTVVGTQTRTVELDLSAEEYARTTREWVSFDLEVKLDGEPRKIRAAVYDYGSDYVFSAAASYRSR